MNDEIRPNTNDMRDSPSLTIVPALVGNGAKVRIVDPQVQREGATLPPCAAGEDCPDAAEDGAYVVVILTEWNEFRAPDLGK